MKISLSIVIPTYCRAEILRSNLDFILDSCERYQIPIYVSDDSIDSNTESTIQELKTKYPFISYKRNIPSLGHDGNLLHSLKLPNTDYVWLLGDSILIKEGAISKIIDIISQDNYDIISINAEGRVLDHSSKGYNNHNEVLSKFGWHTTLTGATIYSKNVIALIDKINFDNYRNFPQFSLIYHHLSINCSFYWVNEKFVSSNKKKKSYWTNDVFSVFIDDWSNAVRNLPKSYDQINQEKLIINHSKQANIFSVKSLLNFRRQGFYNFKKYKEYVDTLPFHSNLRKTTLVAIALAPRIIIKIVYKILSKK